jgi:hypothetical protein
MPGLVALCRALLDSGELDELDGGTFDDALAALRPRLASVSAQRGT